MFEAELIVESPRLSLGEVSAVMECEPDAERSAERGSFGRTSMKTRHVSSWVLGLSWPSNMHAGTEGLSAAIEAWGPTLAERAGRLADEGCVVTVSVYQELRDMHPETTGVLLSREALRWMSIAGAELSIDQTVLGPDYEDDDDASP